MSHFQYDHVIWDWNGTLIDDAWLCADLVNRQLRRFALPELDLETYRRRTFHPVKLFYESLGFDFSQIPFDTMATEFHDQYEARRPECSLHKGAEAALRWFEGKSIAQSVLSAHPHDLLLSSLDFFKLSSFFSKISGLDSKHAHGKLELATRHLEELSSARDRIVIIGDTDHDFEVSQYVGISCMLIASGHQSEERLAGLGVPTFPDFESFKSWLLMDT